MFLQIFKEFSRKKLKIIQIFQSLSVAKTNSIVTGSRKKVKEIQQTSAIKRSLVIRDEDISMVEHTRHLGVQVD